MSAPSFIYLFIYFNFKKIVEVIIVSRVNASATCQFVLILLFGFQFSLYIHYFCSI